ncbi:MAG: phosphoesterase PA-phosphatase related protein [Frankiales bacterium]|nr:phosphoesterase PA-phosphatase related protein [Frankiales bacterium]MCW2585515.1 phosphoesterase PA-phosphatase related protein [Frankiales bacterium]
MTAELEEALPLAPSETSPWRMAGLQARQRRRRLLLGVVVLFTLFLAVFGVPTGREWLTSWMLVTLFAACGGDFSVWRRAVVRDWLPLLGVLFAYDLLRGIANEMGGSLFGLAQLASNPNNAVSSARAHLTEPIEADKALFGGQVPTVWLQERFYDPGVAHWYDRVAVPIYLSHFLVSLTLAIVLWCVNYPLFKRYLAAFVTLTVVVLTTYVLFPAAPPWMAGLNNAFGPGVQIDRVIQGTLHVIGGETVNTAVEKGAAYSNPVAAVPSLHAAIPALLMAFFWTEVRKRGKVFLAVYTALMGLTLVYSGEHYVFDVLLGWLYALIVVLVLRRVRPPVQPMPAENPLTTPAPSSA